MEVPHPARRCSTSSSPAIFKVALSDGPKKPKLPGVVSGLGVTFRTMMEGAVTVQYPHEREEPAPRARGVIALKEENCTVCMLCARSARTGASTSRVTRSSRPPRREGGRPRSVNLLDRFDIDYGALHVLRDLRRGVPVRRALLEPGVRVLRAPHRRAAPRQGASSASGWRPSPSPSRSSSVRKSRARSSGRAERRLLDPRGRDGARRDRRRPLAATSCTPRSTSWSCSAGAAAQYILLAAEFVAWVQVLIYIGAVIILFLFGIMLTRAPMGGDTDLDNDQRWPAAVVAALPRSACSPRC